MLSNSVAVACPASPGDVQPCNLIEIISFFIYYTVSVLGFFICHNVTSIVEIKGGTYFFKKIFFGSLA